MNQDIKVEKTNTKTIIPEKIENNWYSIFEKCYVPNFPLREEFNFTKRDEL